MLGVDSSNVTGFCMALCVITKEVLAPFCFNQVPDFTLSALPIINKGFILPITFYRLDHILVIHVFGSKSSNVMFPCQHQTSLIPHTHNSALRLDGQCFSDIPSCKVLYHIFLRP